MSRCAECEADRAVIDYISADGDTQKARLRSWDVPWESGTASDERTGTVINVVWTGTEWREVEG